MWSFSGRTYIVSGGLSGIGLSTTLRLAAAGAHVWVADISTDTPHAISNHQQSSNIHIPITPTDIRSRTQCHNLISNIVGKHGRLDGLVNCAGICLTEPPVSEFVDLDGVFQKEFDINVRGTFILGTEALNIMNDQEMIVAVGRGTIVNIASIAAQQGIAGLGVYCMSKHAVLGLTRAWSKEWASKGVRINAVAPGQFIRLLWPLDLKF